MAIKTTKKVSQDVLRALCELATPEDLDFIKKRGKLECLSELREDAALDCLTVLTCFLPELEEEGE